MTFLDMINHVLRRLREDEVSTYNETDYSTLVSDLVNDAMIKVQNAHNWSQLQTTTTIATVASTSDYELADSNRHTQIHSVYNDTSNYQLRSATREWMDRQQMGAASSGPPTYWSFVSEDIDGDTTLQFYPTPDAVYSIKVLHNVKQDRLSNDVTNIKVPSEPVLQLAVAYALEERGDTGGQNNMTQMQRANEALADAVALDMSRDPDLHTWVVY